MIAWKVRIARKVMIARKIMIVRKVMIAGKVRIARKVRVASYSTSIKLRPANAYEICACYYTVHFLI